MLSYSRSHLADRVLLRTLDAVVTQDRATTAELLALIGEVDKRQLFRAEGYPSMFRYCVGKLRMSEDVAYKRIQTARAGMRFPAILPAIADGRLHLTAVVLLKSYLTTGNSDDLLTAAAGKTKAEVELLIAERFPREDVPTSIRALEPPGPPQGMLLVQEEALTLANTRAAQAPKSPDVEQMQSKLVPEPVSLGRTALPPPMLPAEPERRVAPLSAGRFELRLTMSQQLHDKLRYAQELLGHAIPTGDVPEILERALDELIAKHVRLKFAATTRPNRVRGSSNPRHIPAAVKRQVWDRDGGQCTYVSENGHRCASRKFLEYDHEQPVARGGTTCVANLRLRCRPHNQLEAERVFGAGFMEEKRSRGRRPSLH